jgi:flagellar motor protein MotB
MKIAVKNGKDSEWKRVPNDETQENDYVQELIYDIPELISVEGLGTDGPNLKVCIKNGAQDDGGLIGVDSDGRITIVECRIPDDSSARRQVMGQALEYAATLWQMSYDEFNHMVLESEGRNLTELMRDKDLSEDWSEEKFKTAVNNTLQNGKFRLVMTIRKMTGELMRTIKFLSVRGPFSFETYAVQIQHFSDGETQIVVPRIISFAESAVKQATSDAVALNTSDKASVRDTKPSRNIPPTEPNLATPNQTAVVEDSSEPSIAQPKVEETKRSEEGKSNAEKVNLFFSKCQETTSKEALDLARKLYDFSKETADEIIWWGAGGAGAFNYVLTEDGLTVFIVDATGKIMFNFSEWQRESSYKNLLPQFIEKLKNIAILRNQKEDYSRWPDFNLEEFFAKPNDFNIFQEAVKFVKEELKNLALV